MNSVCILGKTMFFSSSLRLSRLFLLKHKYCAQNMCSAANFKCSSNSVHENQNSDSKSSSDSTLYYAESDTFGSLKIPMEDRFRSNRSPPTRSIDYKNKKVIHIKRNKLKIEESDTFGNLSKQNPMWYPDIDEESKDDNDLSDDSIIVKKLHKKFRCPRVYLKEMKLLVKQKKIKEALDLFVDMRRNFVAPIHAHYTYMIGVCGRVGYTEMAFKLFRQMTDRAFQPTPATLTGLFNSCAESPFTSYGLKKAHLLKEKIEKKNWQMTQITYHAMIKAFAKCGDLQSAFKIVDEMAKADIKIDVSTYSFLLMSCIDNKQVGFTYAVEVLRMMKAKNCRPNAFTFNLLLRATRDCKVGPEEISSLLLQHWSSYSKRPYGFITKEKLQEEKEKNPILKLNASSNDSDTETLGKEYSNPEEMQNEKLGKCFSGETIPKYELKSMSNTDVIATSPQNSLTNVLSTRPVNGPEILEILNIKTASDRLSLLGGLEGFLNLMFESKVRPNIKTFTLLLECLPDNIEEEEKLLTFLDKYQVKPDIEFFNCLIKQRNVRKDNAAARDALILINKYDLTPDIMTFGALAIGCRSLQQASTFISEMNKLGSYPNVEIVGILIRQACMNLDFSYMKFVLKLMEKQEIKPNKKVLSMVERILSNVRKSIILMEHGKEVEKFYQRKNLQVDFTEFSNFYEEWLKRTKFQSEEHPWSQYKTEIIDRAEEQIQA